MLVLKRKVGESIVIGDTIKVTITQILYSSVVIAISAPKDVLIMREEVVEKYNNSKENHDG